ncbi:hypothetical protein V8C86DRAFT_2556416 [Haematococcus lacustris]
MHDTKYLQTLVGEALARGCAAAVTAQPNDPVEYLGRWLLNYVQNAEIVGEYTKEKEAKLAARKAELEAEQAAAVSVKKMQEERRAVVIDLSTTVCEPRQLFQKAVDLVVKFTKAGAAYAAAVAEPEDPEWMYPEDPDDPAAAESEDEPDPSSSADAEEADVAAEAGEVEEGSPDESGAVKVARPIDYSRKYFSYMAASAGQEFMLTQELMRPPPPPDDDTKPLPVPPTFRILDEKRPMIYTPNVAYEPAVHFMRSFPRIGAYQACGVQSPSTGEFKAIIAADTLFPEAGGQPLCQEDQDFIWSVSRALSQAYEAVEQQAAASLTERSGKQTLDQLRSAIHAVYFPPPAPDAPDAQAAPPLPASTSVPAPTEPVAEEGEAEAEDSPVALIKAEIKALQEELAATEAAREQQAAGIEVAQAVLGLVKDSLLAVGDSAAPALRLRRVVPQATFLVLKAVLHVLGKEQASFRNWKRCAAYFTPQLFQELHEFDATQERNNAAWRAARCCYKALPEQGAQAKMEAELPDSHLGVLLLLWLKQVRKVGRRAAAFRSTRDLEHSLHDQLDAKAVALQAALDEKAAEDEAARKAAEEAAAAEAAEAAEGAEEGGEEDD